MLSPGSAQGGPREGGYLAVDQTSGLVVGLWAFKGPPAADGIVEIAYIRQARTYEGRGHAKGMARALICVARWSSVVHHAIAHVERKEHLDLRRSAGMRFVGEVRDPADGRVWRWRLGFGDSCSWLRV